MNIGLLGANFFGEGGVSRNIEIVVNNKKSSLINYFVIAKNKNYKNKKIINFDINYNFLTLFIKIFLLKKIIKNYKINLVHAHTQRACFLISAVKFLLIPKLIIIYTPHGFRFNQKKLFLSYFHLFLEKWISNYINLLIVITKKEKKLIKKNKIKYKKIIFLGNIFDPNFIESNFNIKKKYQLKDDAKIIISTGGFDTVKQPQLFIKIAKKVIKNNNNAYFILFGSIPTQNIAFLKRIKCPNIFFPGKIKSLEMPSIYRQADIFLLTSRFETFPYSILEASYFKKKIICNNYCGIKEFQNFKNIRTFKYNDSDAAVTIINEELNKKFCGKFKLDNSYYDKKKYISKLEKIYLSFC